MAQLVVFGQLLAQVVQLVADDLYSQGLAVLQELGLGERGIGGAFQDLPRPHLVEHLVHLPAQGLEVPPLGLLLRLDRSPLLAADRLPLGLLG